MPRSCPRCGGALPGAELPIALGSNDPADLERLFSGDLESVRCPACGCDIGEEPQVAVGFDDPAEILVAIPPSLSGRADLIDALRDEAGDAGTVDVVPSIGALREAVIARLRPRIELVSELLTQAAEADTEAALSSWFQLTPAVFAAATLALRRRDLGLDLPPRTGSRATGDWPRSRPGPSSWRQ